MQVTKEVLGTIQFQTSKRDVTIRLVILDQEKEVASDTGMGIAVIPVFYFLENKGEHPCRLVIEVNYVICTHSFPVLIHYIIFIIRNHTFKF